MLIALFILSTIPLPFCTSTIFNQFVNCISNTTSANLSQILLTPNDTSYSTILQSSIQNLRFDTPTTPKPLAIITPLSYSHVQSTVICTVQFGLNIRTRSGGHDYEGLSYTSLHNIPFIILDLNQLRSISVDSKANTAWVESGATLGELSYWVSKKNNLFGFPAGECTSVGVGGQISGGGFGMMARKYGLSADNVIDARVVDVNGRILDRDSMGEDLFWAIRGGGGASFGVVVSWKINLVYVPPIVTVFSLSKTIEGGTQLINKWQHIAHNVTHDLFINLVITPVQLTFNSLFLGTADDLVKTVGDEFPELGLEKKDCIEMSWIESVVYHSVNLRGESIEALVERRPMPKAYFKVKSDYVKKVIPEEALEEILKWDLDLGTNCNAWGTSYGQGMRWGRRYFKGNFKRLAMVKGVVDPTNFFWNEQSIPPLVLSSSY
ncbi:hypothetical protein L1987_77145 [Smallanthus sonchifolius]|uniref:Uncharacterized protein n=1 Tax=Smallanthus sonchifolius TaxID=185202 RepID=A0ACB8Z865_9ASTR|nr:hypothetical protein L1987_77145 [Smallanthus sonchifolius]